MWVMPYARLYANTYVYMWLFNMTTKCMVGDSNGEPGKVDKNAHKIILGKLWSLPQSFLQRGARGSFSCKLPLTTHTYEYMYTWFKSQAATTSLEHVDHLTNSELNSIQYGLCHMHDYMPTHMCIFGYLVWQPNVWSETPMANPARSTTMRLKSYSARCEASRNRFCNEGHGVHFPASSH